MKLWLLVNKGASFKKVMPSSFSGPNYRLTHCFRIVILILNLLCFGLTKPKAIVYWDTESIEEYDWYYKITDTCVECGACVRVCPNKAIIKVDDKEKTA